MSAKSPFSLISDKRYKDQSIIDFLNVTTLKKYKVDSFGNTILMSSIFENRNNLAQHLIENYPDYCFPETINNFGNTALICAQLSKNIQIIESLIQKFNVKCLPNLSSEECDSLFIWSCKFNLESIIELCLTHLNNHIDWDYKDKKGLNALHYIIKNGLVSILYKNNNIFNSFEQIFKSDLNKLLTHDLYNGFMQIYEESNLFNRDINLLSKIYNYAKTNEDTFSVFSNKVCGFVLKNFDFEFLKKVTMRIDESDVYNLLDSCNIFEFRLKLLEGFDKKKHNLDELEFIINQYFLCGFAGDDEELFKIICVLFEKNINFVKKILENYCVNPFFKYHSKSIIDYFLESNDMYFIDELFNIYDNDTPDSKLETFSENLVNKVCENKDILNSNNVIKYYLLNGIRDRTINGKSYLISKIINTYPDYLNFLDIKTLVPTNDESIIIDYLNNKNILFNEELFIISCNKKFMQVLEYLTKNVDVNKEFVEKYIRHITNNSLYKLLIDILNRSPNEIQDNILQICQENLRQQFNINLYKILDNYTKDKNVLYNIIESCVDFSNKKYCSICCENNDKYYLLFDCYHALNVDQKCIEKLKKCPICRKNVFNYMKIYVV